jgi:hypothetical protein
MELQGGPHQERLRRRVILFVPCTVTTITHIHQYINTIYIKSQILHIHKMSCMFQRQISILGEKLMQINMQLVYPIYTYSVKTVNNGSYSYKDVDAIANVMLTYSRIKFTAVSLFVLYVVTCIQTCSIEVFTPQG